MLFLAVPACAAGGNAGVGYSQKPCLSEREFDSAVQKRELKRIINTYTSARSRETMIKWLHRGVKVNGRVVSVPEYLVATARTHETKELKQLLSVYADFYDGDKKGLADNLLEKLAVRHEPADRMELVRTIFDAFGLEKISNRTFLYIVSEGTDESGYQYARFVADKRGGVVNTSRRDTENYPMPYVLNEKEDVCSVLSDRLGSALSSSQQDWLWKTKNLFCASRKFRPWE